MRSLAAHGVEVVYGIPGTHNLGIYAAMPTSGVRHVNTRHEQGAGYAADGYARVTGRPGVVVTTTGPAVLNAAAAAAQAYSDSIPLLVVSPGMPTGHPAHGNGTLHEVKDQSAAMDAVCARSIRVGSVEEIPGAVAECFRLMLEGRPRAVHLEIPLDLVDGTGVVGEPPVFAPQERTVELGSAPELISAAERPVMVVGGGASGAAEQVVALAERLGAPVLMSTNGKGVVPADHPLAVGSGLQHPMVNELADDADVLLVVGSELAPADLWSGPLRPRGRTVRVDVDAVAMETNLSPDVPVLGDARAALDALLDALGDAAAPGAERATAARGTFEAQACAEGSAYLEICTALASALPRDTVVTADNAMVSYYGALGNLATYGPRTFLFPTGLGTLGYALPAAIGAQVGAPGRPVLALQGDGGAMFTIQELAAAAEARLPIVMVVADNGGYGEIGNEMADRDDPVHAVALGRVDFVALAEACGCHGQAVDVTGLAAAVRAGLAADRPTVLHVRETSPATDLLTGDRA